MSSISALTCSKNFFIPPNDGTKYAVCVVISLVACIAIAISLANIGHLQGWWQSKIGGILNLTSSILVTTGGGTLLLASGGFLYYKTTHKENPLPIIQSIREVFPSPPLPLSVEQESLLIPNPAVERIRAAKQAWIQRRASKPYNFINRKERYDGEIIDPFVIAWYSRDYDAVERFLSSPDFQGINGTYLEEIETAPGSFSLTLLTHLCGVIRLGDTRLFQMFLKHPKLDLETPVQKYGSIYNYVCALGPGPQNRNLFFLNHLIKKRVCPTQKGEDGLDSLDYAKKSGIPLDIVEEYWNIQGKYKLYFYLSQAIAKKDMVTFRHLVAIVCLNQSVYGLPILHFALSLFFEQTSPEGIADMIEMIRLLLENGASPNTTSCNGIQALLFVLIHLSAQKKDPIRCTPSGEPVFTPRYQEVIDLLFAHGASFYNAVTNHPLINPGTQMLAIQCTLVPQLPDYFPEFENRSLISTILGIKTETYLYDNYHKLHGENKHTTVWRFTLSSLDAFLEKAPLFPLSTLRPSLEFAYTYLTQNVSLEKIREVWQKQDMPLIIPSGWNKHAIAIVLYKEWVILANRGESHNSPPGLAFYRIKDQNLHPILLNKKMTKSFTASDFSKTWRKAFGKPQAVLPLPNQKHPNCSWSSCVSAGVLAALVVQQEHHQITPEIKAAHKQFNQFMKSQTIIRYLNHLQLCYDRLPCHPAARLLDAASLVLASKIKRGKDLFGYYQTALDAIVYSGIFLRPRPSYPENNEKHYTALASLYGVSDLYTWLQLMSRPTQEEGEWVLDREE